jgi:hypothetical protein
MRFLGIDLAWGEGSEVKPAHDSGVVALDQSGEVADAGWTSGLAPTQAWIEEFAQADTLLFIDAPLIVNNPSGSACARRKLAAATDGGRSPPTPPICSLPAWLACICGSDLKPWAGAMTTADLVRRQSHG